ncbi:MAG TPA: ArdC family protein [Candidatus Acidoferrales bacterium]|nr:ArdC family protein [Candidatus Acidoferrales bacterium]HEV3480927.1 ArdC family protein [Candidatus Acidoferrales bacterium]
MKSEQIKQITSKAIEELIAALNSGRSEALTNYLAAMGRFHRYSFFNVMLIARACPQATRVAGYQTWKSLGRYVTKGEKGIMILAPVFRRRKDENNQVGNLNPDSNDSRALVGFRAVYVFDESMTAGEPVPQIGSVNGDPGCYRERLEHYISEQGITLEYSAEIAPAKGVSEGGKITVLPNQSPAETVATLMHEIAHERLHRADRRASTTKRIRETEAEAVAFVVCQAIGLETGTASADYISLWNGDAAVLLENLELVQRTATEIIAATTPDQPTPPDSGG